MHTKVTFEGKPREENRGLSMILLRIFSLVPLMLQFISETVTVTNGMYSSVRFTE